MKEFDLVREEKCTVWVRTFHRLEAETIEEAIEMANQSEGVDVSETLYDTMEAIPIEQNGGYSTLEIFLNNTQDNPVFTNGKT
jgi:predicted  nucleic acid-binding Zn-ribbon protein